MQSDSQTRRVIKKLPQDVIDKIAASEVLQRPSNAVKQLVQNSLDADASAVLIEIAGGGLTSIQVMDNGKGIAPQDFPLLCQRFATSKISSYQDLLGVTTFGFRGEALASLSHAAHVEVVSRQRGSMKTYAANFSAGKMLQKEPELSRMNEGTKIIAKNLYGSLSQIRRSTLNPSQETKRIRSFLTAVAVHYSNKRFKFLTEKGVDFTTEHLSKNQSNPKLHIFEHLYQLPRSDILHFEEELLKDTPQQSFHIEAIMTKLSPENCRSRTLITFINNRLVESDLVRKAVEQAYHNCYNSIHESNQKYYCHLGIKINPKLVDCNVSPTKQTVKLVAQANAVAKAIEDSISRRLRLSCSVKVVGKLAPPPVIFGSQPISEPYMQRVSSQDGRQMRGFEKLKVDSLQLPIQKYMPMPQKSSTQGLQEQRDASQASQKPTIAQKIMSQPVPGRRDNDIARPIRVSSIAPGKQSNTLPISVCREFPKNSQTKTFIKRLSYVGCHGLNYLFVHYEDKLYFMNILPFLPYGLTSWLKKESKIYVHKINNEDVLVQRCLSDFQKTSRIDFDLLQYVKILAENQQEIFELIRVRLSRDGRINALCVPLDFLEDKPINCVEVGYLLARVAKSLLLTKSDHSQNFSNIRESAKAKLRQDCEKYLIEYFVTLFAEETEDIPEHNQLYNYFYQNKFLPHLKTDTDFEQIEFSKYMQEMLSLKKAYKLFERIC